MKKKLLPLVLIFSVLLIGSLLMGCFGVPERVVEYTLTFDANGGSAVESIMIAEGGEITQPANPTKNGYVFEGWFDDEDTTQAFDFSDKMPAQDFTLYAKWAKGYKIEFVTGEGADQITALFLPEGAKVSSPDTPTFGEFNFSGWFTDAYCTQSFTFPDTMPAKNIKLYAKWAREGKIIFESNGGSKVEPLVLAEGTPLTEPTAPIKDGYEFIAWFINDEYIVYFGFTDSVMAPGTRTVYAKWAKIYNIEFETNGGSTIPTISQQENTYLSMPKNPTKDGYAFGGWYTDENLTTKYTFPSKMPIEDVKLYAKWDSAFKISFETNGGTVINALVGVEGTFISTQPVTTRDNYKFIGWYSDAELTQIAYIPLVMPAENLTLYAKWARESKISFETNGGSIIPTISQQENTYLSMPKNPTKDGYAFGGWYTDENLTTKYTFPSKMPTEDVKLYAKWNSACKITFVTNGGTAIQALVEIEGTLILTQPVTTRHNYKFVGWYSDADLTQVTGIPLFMPAESLALYAKWEFIGYTLTFDSKGGTSISGENYMGGSTVTAPSNPEKDIYDFGGWYLNVDCTVPFDFVMPSRDTTVYALWQIKGEATAINLNKDWISYDQYAYSIFYYSDGTVSVTTTEQKLPYSYIRIDIPYSLKGYSKFVMECQGFAGLDVLLKCENKDKTSPFVTVEKHFYMSGELQTIEWTVNSNNLTDGSSDLMFLIFIDVRSTNADINLYIKSLKLYADIDNRDAESVLIFDNMQVGGIDPVFKDAGELITAPQQYDWAFYTFDGWYLDKSYETEFTFGTMPKGLTMLYAKWSPFQPNPDEPIDITLDATLGFFADGQNMLIHTVPRWYRLNISELPIPTHPNSFEYYFAGWFKDKELTAYFIDDTPIYEYITLYAGWQTVNEEQCISLTDHYDWINYTNSEAIDENYLFHKNLDGSTTVTTTPGKRPYAVFGMTITQELRPYFVLEIEIEGPVGNDFIVKTDFGVAEDFEGHAVIKDGKHFYRWILQEGNLYTPLRSMSLLIILDPGIEGGEISVTIYNVRMYKTDLLIPQAE